jgi:adhesin/invasin
VRVLWAVTAGGGTLSSNATDTDGQGSASVGWTLGVKSGRPQTVTASVSGLAGSPVTFTATAVPGPPAKIASVAGDSQTATVNTLLPTSPAVQVRDVNDNAVPGAPVTFAVTGGGGSITGVSASTSDSGIAAVGGWTLGTASGANTLSATVGTVVPFVFFARGTAAAPKTITVVEGDNQSAVAGQTVAVAPAVVVRDTFGNAVPGVTVTFAVATGGGSVTGGGAVTDSAGAARVTSWRLGTTAGANTLSATVAGVAPVTFTAQGLAGAPAALTAVTGEAQSATVGTAVAVAPAVRVADSNNNPIFGVSVSFAVASGGGNVTGAAASTDSSGVARVGSWTLGTTAGANALTATVTGVPVLTLTATGTPDVPASAGVNAGDGQSATVNTAVLIAPSVMVKDQYQNPVPGVAVSFAVVSGGGALTGASATTDGAGVAASGSWQLGIAAGVNTVSATAAGLPPVTFTATGLPAAPATASLLSGDGQSATVGTAVPVPPALVVRDQYGNAVPGAAVTFVVATGGGGTAGASVLTDGSGVASVGSWTLGQLAGANQLNALVSGVGTPVIYVAQGTPAPPASITVLQGNNQTATAGAAVAVGPVVVIRDAFGNPAPGIAVSFTVTGGGSVTNAAAETNPNGVAGAGTWTLGTVAGLNTLTATSPGLSAATFVASGVPGPAASVAVWAGNGQSAVAGTAVSEAPAVVVRDANGNGVAGVSVSFSVTGGGGSISGSPAVTGLDGVARAASWMLSTVVGANTAAATVTGTGITGNPAAFAATGTPGAPASLAVSAGDGQTAVAGSAVSTAPAVLVKDANGNVVPGVAVTFAVASGGGSVTGGSATTSAAGVATAGSWTLGTVAGVNSLTATVAGLLPLSFTATGVPGSPASMVVSAGAGQSAVVGTAVAIRPAVVVRDANGNAVSGVAVAFSVTAGGGSVSGAAQTTDAAGLARVGGWTLGTVVGTNTLEAAVAGLSPAAFSATALVGAPAVMAVSAGNNQSATVGTAVAIAPSVRVADQYDNPVGGVSVSFVVTGGGGSVTGGSAVTNSSGVAAVGSWTLGTAVGANTLTAAASGLNDVTFTATGLVGAAASVAVSAGDNQAAQVATEVTVAPAVVVRDQYGNPVSGVDVTFAVASGGGVISGPATVATGSAGVAAVGGWTLGNAPGVNTLAATAAGVAAGVSFSATATAGPPSAVNVAAGDGQSATVGTAVAVKPKVRVLDALGNPLAGQTVTFSVVSGGGSVTAPSQSTDADGFAEVGSWTLGTAVGSNSLAASVAGLSPAVFTATATVGAPATLQAAAGDGQTAVAGAEVAVDPAVVVKDQYGNPVSGVSVSFAVATGGGAVSGSPAATDAAGVARLASWTLGTAAGANSLSVTAAGLTPLTFTATGVPGWPATVTVSAGNNQTAVAGLAVTIAVAVVVSDANGNVVPGVSVTFAVSLGGGEVTGGAATTDAAGVAAAGSWTLGATAGPNELTATVSGLSPAVFSATGVAGAPSSMTLFSGNNQSAVAGAAVAASPTVLVRDANLNPVAGASVSWAVSGGGGGVTAAASSTGADGRASVGWTLGTTAGANTLTASLEPLADVVFSATGTPGAPATVSVSAGDAQSATVGTAVAAAPAVLVRDANGNPVPGVAVTFAISSGGGSLTGASQVTSASGVAAAGSWTLGTAVGVNTLSATVAGLSPASFAATATVGSPASMVVLAGDNQSAVVNNSLLTSPAVVVLDAYGNPVPGVSVAFAVQSGAGSVTDAVDTTDGAGAAAVGGWRLGTVAGANTLTASAGGLQVLFTAGGTPGPPASMGINGGNNQIAVYNEVVPVTPTVVVRDQFGNPTPGVSVLFVVGAGGGQITGSTRDLTDQIGVAGIDTWRLGFGGLNTLVAVLSDLPNVTFSATAASGGLHSCVVQPTETLCWGFNNAGQLGDGTVINRNVPTRVSGAQLLTQVATGGQHSCGLTSAGEAWCWGNNFYSQLGDGTATTRLSPVPVQGGLTFSRIATGFFHTCAVATDGRAFCWGRNQFGQLGDSSTETRATPVLVSGGQTFVDIAAGFSHTCGLTEAGVMYCWGYNRQGQLGTGLFVAAPIPGPVSTGETFAGLTAGGAYTCGFTAAGTAYCWGFNFFGQLGDNSLNQRATPVPVVTATQFAAMGAGFHTTCGLATTGEAWCWGRNDAGQVGDGTTVSRLTPAAVAGGLTFTSVSVEAFHACGRTPAGSVYCWGDNAFGQVGDGSLSARSTPTLIIP